MTEKQAKFIQEIKKTLFYKKVIDKFFTIPGQEDSVFFSLKADYTPLDKEEIFPIIKQYNVYLFDMIVLTNTEKEIMEAVAC